MQALTAREQDLGGTDGIAFGAKPAAGGEAVGFAGPALPSSMWPARPYPAGQLRGQCRYPRAAYAESLSAEVTPHNLLLDENQIVRQGPVAKVAPPLRPASDLAAVQAALRAA